jgi:hypothetical protein
MAAKYLYFANSATDAITVNTAHISMIDLTGAAQIQIYFRSNDAVDFSGSVLVNFTSGYNKEFVKALVKEIATSRQSFITVADDVNNDFFETASGGTQVIATSCGTIALS